MPALDPGLVIIGVVGGALPDLIRFVKVRHKKNLPAYLRRPQFWLGFGVLLILGGMAAWLLEAQDSKSALALGFAAPEIFSRLASKPEDIDRGISGKFSIRQWWSN